ncbi:hypothetical protein KCM76_22155 [Zooshikella marina]|uniref:hypothetical protein n=1 Tax=Zooshikella ganghwensis TaxID=202772 RepID=UPI001BAF57AB|nr:hypothetical protein [Zooshikella ganghwensis]MBU2708712.1 hypothetical protein [Zooshikella ganghwensis]
MTLSTELTQRTADDLEAWRLKHGLTKLEASMAFGITENNWINLTKPDVLAKPLQDAVIVMHLELFNQHPELVPNNKQPDIKEFYTFLGLKDDPKDREMFAKLIGRSTSSACRLLMHDGTTSKAVSMWIQSLVKLNLSPNKTLLLMKKIAKI